MAIAWCPSGEIDARKRSNLPENAFKRWPDLRSKIIKYRRVMHIARSEFEDRKTAFDFSDGLATGRPSNIVAAVQPPICRQEPNSSYRRTSPPKIAIST